MGLKIRQFWSPVHGFFQWHGVPGLGQKEPFFTMVWVFFSSKWNENAYYDEFRLDSVDNSLIPDKFSAFIFKHSKPISSNNLYNDSKMLFFSSSFSAANIISHLLEVHMLNYKLFPNRRLAWGEGPEGDNF